jgi:hypothetical protein
MQSSLGVHSLSLPPVVPVLTDDSTGQPPALVLEQRVKGTRAQTHTRERLDTQRRAGEGVVGDVSALCTLSPQRSCVLTQCECVCVLMLLEQSLVYSTVGPRGQLTCFSADRAEIRLRS